MSIYTRASVKRWHL